MRSPVGALVSLANRIEQPPPYVGRASTLARVFGGRNDAEHQMRAMGSVGTLFAIVDRLAGGTSRVGWKLYRSAKSGLDEDRVEITSHAALDLWRRPNRFYTGALFRESSQQHFELVGESWWVIVRSPRMRTLPLELWPVRPDRMYPVPSTESFLAGYIYLGPDGEQVPLELDDVIQIRRPNPWDPYRGIGAVQTILADIDSARLSAEWNRNFFLNSAQPGGIIEVPTRLSDQQFAEKVERWREQHQGVANSHRVAVIEEGVWKDRNYSMRDMQFTELRGVQRELIREAFAFPKSELGTVDDVNRANAEAGALTLARGHIVPRLDRIRDALNEMLLPMYGPTGQGLEWDYDPDVVPNDRAADDAELTAKANAAATLRGAGWAPAAVLEAVGLPEMEYVEPAKPEPMPATLRAVPEPVDPPAKAATAARALPSGIVNASPDHSTGCMIALYPPPGLAEQLAVPGGLPVADLHLTVAYCGDAADVDAGTLMAAVRSLTRRAAIRGKITGAARFTGGEDGDVIVALVDSPDLEDLRRDVTDRLTAAGIEYPRDHGFTPHITLTYLDAGARSPVERLENTPVTFGALSVVHGEDRTDLPFTTASPAALHAPRAAADVPDGELPDLAPVQDSWLAALAELLAQWATVLPTWIDQLAAQVRDHVAAGDRPALADLTLTDDEQDNGHALLAAAMVRLAYEAARQVTTEAAAQGVTIDAGTPDEDALDETARLIVATLARELAISAGREALRISTPGETDADEADRVAAAVRAHLDQIDDPRARQWLGNALTQAQHAGRTATMRAAERSAPSVAYYGQEQNDGRTCTYCREVDGRWLGNSLTEALGEYPTGGYIRCLGGPRCRGMVAAVYRPETVGSPA